MIVPLYLCAALCCCLHKALSLPIPQHLRYSNISDSLLLLQLLLLQTQQEAGSAISRDEWEMHGKTISEGLGCLNWVAVAPPAGLPKDIAESAVGGSDYWANKIRVTYKKSGPAEQVCRKNCSLYASAVAEVM
jgi:hypothetical protein